MATRAPTKRSAPQDDAEFRVVAREVAAAMFAGHGDRIMDSADHRAAMENVARGAAEYAEIHLAVMAERGRK